jgi:hypothetical protein
MLLYNLAVDQGEINDVSNASNNSAVIATIGRMMEEQHVENKYWPSVSTDPTSGETNGTCCANCFNRNGKGCPAPCFKGGGPSPTPDIPLESLSGTWVEQSAGSSSIASEHPHQKGAAFALVVNSTALTFEVHNLNCSNCCWNSTMGLVTSEGNTFSNVRNTNSSAPAKCKSFGGGTVKKAADGRLCVDWNVWSTPWCKSGRQ